MAGAKTIAINLPNDEQVQLAKGTRRLQLKNAMLAKFNRILMPIAKELIAGDQRPHVTFDSFFGNTMFHEVAHGLGIKNTLDGSNTVRFGASSAHGRANMIRFNFFSEAGAFSRDEASGAYRIKVPEFEAAVEALSRRLLTLQGDGDYDAVAAFVDEMGNVGPRLQADLDRLASADIPVDIVYEQGKEVLGLAD